MDAQACSLVVKGGELYFEERLIARSTAQQRMCSFRSMAHGLGWSDMPLLPMVTRDAR